jgi:predicted RNA binding protein YcfA (HicA-like mRNA interferase family)
VPLKVSELIKIIEADGGYLDHVTGSHRQFRHAVKPGTTTIAGTPSDTSTACARTGIRFRSRRGPRD